MLEKRSPEGKPKTTNATPSRQEDRDAQGTAIELARLLADDRCEHVMVLDVRGLSQVSDFLVVGSGTSDRQMHSVLEHAVELAEERGHAALRTSEDSSGTWMLADLVDIVIHVFEPNTRAYYDIETLWGDADRIPWERPEDLERDRAGLRGDDYSDDE